MLRDIFSQYIYINLKGKISLIILLLIYMVLHVCNHIARVWTRQFKMLQERDITYVIHKNIAYIKL